MDPSLVPYPFGWISTYSLLGRKTTNNNNNTNKQKTQNGFKQKLAQNFGFMYPWNLDLIPSLLKEVIKLLEVKTFIFKGTSSNNLLLLI